MSWTFATKPDIVVHHQRPECFVAVVVCRPYGQGLIEGWNLQGISSGRVTQRGLSCRTRWQTLSLLRLVCCFCMLLTGWARREPVARVDRLFWNQRGTTGGLAAAWSTASGCETDVGWMAGSLPTTGSNTRGTLQPHHPLTQFLQWWREWPGVTVGFVVWHAVGDSRIYMSLVIMASDWWPWFHESIRMLWLLSLVLRFDKKDILAQLVKRIWYWGEANADTVTGSVQNSTFIHF